MTRLRPVHWIVAALALLALVLSLWRLEGARAGLEITRFDVGTTPATLYRLPDDDRPLVVVSHGFAGSRQLMEAYSLTLARRRASRSWPSTTRGTGGTRCRCRAT